MNEAELAVAIQQLEQDAKYKCWHCERSVPLSQPGGQFGKNWVHTFSDGYTRICLANEMRLAPLVVESDALAGLLKRHADAIFDLCYEVARGHTHGDGFQIHGSRQLYWKGRSDVATEIRIEKERYVQSRPANDSTGGSGGDTETR